MYHVPANKNYLEAQFCIGMDYLEGNGIKEDHDQALEWFYKAANEDYAPAQDAIGCMYSYGFGVEQDYSRAFDWCLKAANQGYDKAQNNVAYLYKEGLGVAQDSIKAVDWYKKAAEQGDAEAHKNLKLLNEADIDIAEEVSKPFSFKDLFSSSTGFQSDTSNTHDDEETYDDNETLDINDKDENSLVPFSNFFKDYFHDESGLYPENSGGGVWFTENMSFKERDKFFNKIYKVQEKYDNQIDLQGADFIIDTTITKNFGAGVFATACGRFTLKYLSSEWKTINNTELKKASYCDSDHNLYINGFEISMVSDNARFYGERLAECINAYLKQNDHKKSEQNTVSNSELVTGALDNIDGRLAEIEEKLASLQNDLAA